MMLSQSSKYAVRACLYLAANDGPVLSREIADALGAPAQFLAKILQGLARDGVLQSTRGRGGGFRLALPGSRISLLRIVQAIEGPGFGAGCVLGLERCSDEAPCALHDTWKGSRGAFLEALEQTCLSDVRTPPR